MMLDTRRAPVDPTLPRPSWQQEQDEIRDTLEAYAELARFDADTDEARARDPVRNHADHLAYVREEYRMAGWCRAPRSRFERFGHE